jgi:hypothetical protein
VSVDRLADRSPYAAALIAEHAVFVYRPNRGKPEWQDFFATIEERRATLLARLGVTLEQLQADYPFLGIADLMSLSFCHGWTESNERFGRTIRCHGSAVEISPPMLPPAPLPLHVRARRIDDRAYPSASALRDALAAATPEFLAGVARNGPAS